MTLEHLGRLRRTRSDTGPTSNADRQVADLPTDRALNSCRRTADWCSADLVSPGDERESRGARCARSHDAFLTARGAIILTRRAGCAPHRSLRADLNKRDTKSARNRRDLQRCRPAVEYRELDLPRAKLADSGADLLLTRPLPACKPAPQRSSSASRSPRSLPHRWTRSRLAIARSNSRKTQWRTPSVLARASRYARSSPFGPESCGPAGRRTAGSPSSGRYRAHRGIATASRPGELEEASRGHADEEPRSSASAAECAPASTAALFLRAG
jgi:hypothetical protein